MLPSRDGSCVADRRYVVLLVVARIPAGGLVEHLSPRDEHLAPRDDHRRDHNHTGRDLYNAARDDHARGPDVAVATRTRLPAEFASVGR